MISLRVNKMLSGCRLCLFEPLVSAFNVMTGFESMRFVGFPYKILQGYLDTMPQKFSEVDSIFADMGGNAFSAGPWFALVIAVLLSVDPTKLKANVAGHDASESDNDDDSDFEHRILGVCED